jgi:hypothetical protein
VLDTEFKIQITGLAGLEPTTYGQTNQGCTLLQEGF